MTSRIVVGLFTGSEPVKDDVAAQPGSRPSHDSSLCAVRMA